MVFKAILVAHMAEGLSAFVTTQGFLRASKQKPLSSHNILASKWSVSLCAKGSKSGIALLRYSTTERPVFSKTGQDVRFIRGHRRSDSDHPIYRICFGNQFTLLRRSVIDSNLTFQRSSVQSCDALFTGTLCPVSAYAQGIVRSRIGGTWQKRGSGVLSNMFRLLDEAPRQFHCIQGIYWVSKWTQWDDRRTSYGALELADSIA